MPPFLMLILVAFAVLMVAFGRNPVDEWKANQAKYGKDPLVRKINKYMEKSKKDLSMSKRYRPPEGATVYTNPNPIAPSYNNYGMQQPGTNGLDPYANRPYAGAYGSEAIAPPAQATTNLFPPHMYRQNAPTNNANQPSGYYPNLVDPQAAPQEILPLSSSTRSDSNPAVNQKLPLDPFQPDQHRQILANSRLGKACAFLRQMLNLLIYA